MIYKVSCRIVSAHTDTPQTQTPMTDVLSIITQAGFNPKRIHYGNLRKLFFAVIEWLHHESHKTDKLLRSSSPTQEQFDIAIQLLQNDYLRGVIEGRFSRCTQGGAEHQTVFEVIDENTISMTTKSFSYD